MPFSTVPLETQSFFSNSLMPSQGVKVTPFEYPDKVFLPRCVGMICCWRPHDRISAFVWTKHRNVTDRQTDRQIVGQTVRGYYSALQCAVEITTDTVYDSTWQEKRRHFRQCVLIFFLTCLLIYKLQLRAPQHAESYETSDFFIPF